MSKLCITKNLNINYNVILIVELIPQINGKKNTIRFIPLPSSALDEGNKLKKKKTTKKCNHVT